MPPMRRAHTKSRTGCTNCKRRKVKCDEHYPICFNCKRQHVVCSLSGPSQPEHSSRLRIAAATPDTEATDSTGQGRDTSPPEPSLAEEMAPIPPIQLWEKNFELLHHYCTVTADSMSSKPEICQVWRISIPKEGYGCPYIMHGILALAATHKAYLFPYHRRKYLILADYHQTVGSKDFRMALQAAQPEHAVALFASAVLVVMYTMTLPGRRLGGPPNDPIQHFMELAGMFKGLMGTISPMVSSVLRSELAPLVFGVWPFEGIKMREISVSLEYSFLPPDTWQALEGLREILTADIPSSSSADYLDALDKMDDLAKLVAFAGAHVETGAVISWILRTEKSVLEDVRAHRPYALLLLAYYCVFWVTIEKNFWYAKEWSRRLFDFIEAKLIGQDKFEELLQWPRRSLLVMGL